MTPPSFERATELEQIFPGHSQMAKLMRAYDWSEHELGTPGHWPQNLRISLALCLTSSFPMLLLWGPEAIFLYNDAAIPLIGESRHPHALGQPVRQCWGEIWKLVGPLLDGVRTAGQSTGQEDAVVYFNRRLPAEEVFIRFSCGPILAADGRTVDGIFMPCTETTTQTVSARRLETLRKLGIRTVEDGAPESACQDAAAILDENRHDVPFAAIYLVDEQRSRAVLTAMAGLAGKAWPLPESVSLSAGTKSPWPLRFVLRTHRPEEVDLQAQGIELPGGPWPDPAAKALVLPMMATGSGSLAGLLIAGVSSRQALDAGYRTFFDLVATHIGTSVADAQAREAERRRADALAEVDRAKTAFLANVSHEFRTPLTLILGPLEEELRGHPYASERLEIAHRNSLRLLKLVNGLLDYSRIEAGRAEAIFEPVDLASLTAELASNFRAAIEKAGMALIVECDTLPDPVYVDPEMWEKIVLNLLSNAFKYTLRGSIRVTQKARGQAVELAVQDTGSGIPAAELPHLFERFHRVKWIKARSVEGSGIGLALVQELVKLHSGSIRVESVPEQGSTFTVSIPFGKAHLPPESIGPARGISATAEIVRPYVEEALQWISATVTEPQASEATGSGTATARPAEAAQRQRATIVWAEDNDDLRQYVQRLLTSSYEVKAVANGGEALAAVRQHLPDLVLADVMMPHGDGFDLLRELRSDPKTRSIPVVLLSARAGEEALIEGREAGADDYVAKPFAARELLARISSNVNLARVRRESELRIAALVESAMDAIISIDEDQRIVLFNRAAAAMFHCPASEALGTPIERFIPERFRAAHREHIARFTRTGTTSRAMGRQLGVLWGLRADGEEFPIEASISQVQLDWHRQLTVILRDITERLKAEADLRESRERIHGLVESAMDAIISIDEKQHIILFNHAAEAMFRCTAADALGTHVERFIPGRFRAAHREHIARFAQTGTTSRSMGHQLGVLRGLRADGEEFPIEASISQLSIGGQRQLTVIVRDITERQRQQAALMSLAQNLESRVAAHTELLGERNRALDDGQKQLSLALTAGHACTFEMEVPGYETCWTKDLLALYGMASEAPGASGILWLECIVPEDREATRAAIEQAFGSGEFKHDFRIRRFDNGDIRWLSGRARVIFDDAGKPARLSGILIDITDRRAAQSEIEGGRLRLAAVLDSLNEGVVVSDLEGKVLDMNPAALKLIGFKNISEARRRLPEFVDQFELRSPDGAVLPLDRWPLARVLRGESFVDYELEVHKKDTGETFILAYNGTPVVDREGKAFLAVLTLRDIRRQKEAERAIRENEYRLALALKVAGTAVWEIDVATGQVLGADDLLFTMLGYSPGENATLAEWLALIHADDRARISELIGDVISGKRESYLAELRQRTKDGNWRWILCQATAPERDHEGRARRLLGAHTDIDARKRIEEALRQERSRLQAILDNSPVLISVKDTESRMILANQAIFDTVQVPPPEQLLGRSIFESFPPEVAEALWSNDLAAMASDAPIRAEETVQHRDGSWHTYMTVKFPVREIGSSKLLGIAAISTDITELKAAEAEIRRLNAELEERVRERTAELARSTEALLHSNMELQRFAHAAAHDLQTPLRSIAGFAQLLRQKVLSQANPEVNLWIDQVVNNTQRLQALIQELLSYTSLDAQGLPFEEVDMDALLGEVLDSLSSLTSRTGTELIRKPLPKVLADRSQMAQLWQNLLENGIKYNQSNPPRIAVTSERQDEVWVFSVADNGIGIDPRHHERIFEIFRRLHTYAQVPGSGIGLALCRRIVERHGGRIWVESRPGEGSTFYFSLPVHREAAG